MTATLKGMGMSAKESREKRKIVRIKCGSVDV